MDVSRPQAALEQGQGFCGPMSLVSKPSLHFFFGWSLGIGVIGSLMPQVLFFSEFIGSFLCF